MLHRPLADRVLDHRFVSLLFIAFGLVTGIGLGAVSLLLRWPGLNHSNEVLRRYAEVHSALFILYSALPVLLGGLTMSGTMRGVGARTVALPELGLAGLAFLGISAGCAVVGLSQGSSSLVPLAAATACVSILAIAGNLAATFLIQRSRSYAAVPPGSWVVLTGALLAVVSAPLAAGSVSSMAIQGRLPDIAIMPVAGPLLIALSVLAVGIVDRIFRCVVQVRRGATFTEGVFTAAMSLCALIDFSRNLGHQVPQIVGRLEPMVMLLAILPLEVSWLRVLIRFRSSTVIPTVFAIGFAISLPMGLLGQVGGYGGHDSLSLAIVFAMFAGFHAEAWRLNEGWFNRALASAQLILLLGGIAALLFPLTGAPVLGALASASIAVALTLFAAQLAVTMLGVVADRAIKPTTELKTIGRG